MSDNNDFANVIRLVVSIVLIGSAVIGTLFGFYEPETPNEKKFRSM